MFDNHSNNESERRPRPRFHRDGESARPRFQREGDHQPRPRFQREGDDQRPRFRQDGERRPNRPFNKPKRNNGLYSERKQQNYRQQHEDPTKPIRLNKFLANAGICSRREADDFIQAGVITVNGQVVDNLGVKVEEEQSAITVYIAKPNQTIFDVAKALNVLPDSVDTAELIDGKFNGGEKIFVYNPINAEF